MTIENITMAARAHFQRVTKALAKVGNLKSNREANQKMLTAAESIGLAGYINPRLTRGQLFVRFNDSVRGYFPIAPDGSLGKFALTSHT